ncbi:putative F-box domain, leucine-rich repeat domain superfamily, F-box-like domain superfamily [Helianthus annuus]|nr:putative F-box domain, leucine-rich repeat domain superfamily, F-box-like domain superfamily [Helianthus annuus]
MELIKGTHKVSKVASGGIISSMPDNVVTNILDRLPLQDAVRTSILSRNWRQGIKDLTICNDDGPLLNLPTHLFSCLELRHLKLDSCYFDPPASFHGFPNLLSLELHNVQIESGEVIEFFSQCPALTNLKMLTYSLCYLDGKLVSSSIIFELLGVLPKLQELYLEFLWFKFLEDGAKKRSPTSFPCLKTLKLSAIDLENAAICSLDVDYNTMGMLQLRSVVFTYSNASESEVYLIKYILACSPFLKKIVIRPRSCLALGEQLMFARKLLKLHRASPNVDINLC